MMYVDWRYCLEAGYTYCSFCQYSQYICCIFCHVLLSLAVAKCLDRPSTLLLRAPWYYTAYRCAGSLCVLTALHCDDICCRGFAYPAVFTNSNSHIIV